MRRLRLLIVILFVLFLTGCSDDSESSTYPIGQTGQDCIAYKGFDRDPPEIVIAELSKRGLDSHRLIRKTVCAGDTNWELLPEGASLNQMPPPGMYVNVWMKANGSIFVSTDDPDSASLLKDRPPIQ